MTTKRAGAAAPRKDPRTGGWYFVVDGGKDPATGRRRQVYRRGFRTQKDAAEALDKIRGARRTATYVPPAKITVSEYMTKWLAGLPAQGRRPSTVDGYRRCLDYLVPDLGAKRLDALTVHDLDALYGRLLKSGKRQKPYGGLSPRSVRYVHTVVRKALSDAVKKGTLVRNVAEVASPPSAKSAKPPEMAWWTPEELRSFLHLTGHEPYGPLFRVAAMTGMRRGEVCGLPWSNVDLDQDTDRSAAAAPRRPQPWGPEWRFAVQRTNQDGSRAEEDRPRPRNRGSAEEPEATPDRAAPPSGRRVVKRARPRVH